MRSSLLARWRVASLASVREFATRHSSLTAVTPAVLVTAAVSPSIPSHRPQPRPQASSFLPRRHISSSARHPFPSSATATASTSERGPGPGPGPAQNPSTSASARPQEPPQATTHYTFFPKTLPHGPPPHGPFAIDTRALKREFLSLQSRAHPDLAAHGNKSSAQALSARINEAYKILSSPLLRAQYLLHLRGEDVGLGEEGKTDDPELLMEVMETHHAIEDAVTEEELEGIRRENEDRIRACEGRLGGLFDRGEVEGNDGVLGELREEAIRLKYWVAVREKIHEWEVEKGTVHPEED